MTRKTMLPATLVLMMIGVLMSFLLTANAEEILLGRGSGGKAIGVETEEELLQLYRTAKNFDPVCYAAGGEFAGWEMMSHEADVKVKSKETGKSEEV